MPSSRVCRSHQKDKPQHRQDSNSMINTWQIEESHTLHLNMAACSKADVLRFGSYERNRLPQIVIPVWPHLDIHWFSDQRYGSCCWLIIPAGARSDPNICKRFIIITAEACWDYERSLECLLFSGTLALFRHPLLPTAL